MSLQQASICLHVIDDEDKLNPLSDQAIVEILAKRDGIQIARRTVAKYREMLGILRSPSFRPCCSDKIRRRRPVARPTSSGHGARLARSRHTWMAGSGEGPPPAKK